MTGRPDAPRDLRDLVRLRRVRDRMDREYAQPLDVEALARDAHMSAGHFSREFRAAYGESPYGYLMTRRIERAMALLRRGDLTVTDVCFAVGCSSLGTFSTRFSELVGVPPSVYRREAVSAPAELPSCVVKQVTRPVRNREAPLTGPQLAWLAHHTTTTLGATMTDSGNQGIKTVLHPVTDLAAAKAVYTALLGIEPQADAEYYVGYDFAGQHIGLVPNGAQQGMTGPVAYWHVTDIEAKLAELTAAGAKINEPAKNVGGSRLVATVTDPDGNVLGLLQD